MPSPIDALLYRSSVVRCGSVRVPDRLRQPLPHVDPAVSAHEQPREHDGIDDANVPRGRRSWWRWSVVIWSDVRPAATTATTSKTAGFRASTTRATPFPFATSSRDFDQVPPNRRSCYRQKEPKRSARPGRPVRKTMPGRGGRVGLFDACASRTGAPDALGKLRFRLTSRSTGRSAWPAASPGRSPRSAPTCLRHLDRDLRHSLRLCRCASRVRRSPSPER